MSICGVPRAASVAILTAGFVAISLGIDRITRVDCCEGVQSDEVATMQSQIAALSREIEMLRGLLSLHSDSTSCEDIQAEIFRKEEKLYEMDSQIKLLETELGRDNFFLWLRASEYPLGTNCSVHLEYPEGHECILLKTLHLREVREVERKAKRVEDLRRGYLENVLAKNQDKKHFSFKNCTRYAPSSRGNLTGRSHKRGVR